MSERTRWLRFRWLSGGCLLGVIAGILITLGVSAIVVSRVPAVVQVLTGDPDVSVTISESYLNSEATRRINGAYPTGIDGLTVSGVQINLAPENRMDLEPTFHAAALFIQFDFNARVTNQITVEDGKLAIKMVGNPQLGDINVPIDLLPFNLDQAVRDAVDRVNNTVLLDELNQAVSGSFQGRDLGIDGVVTDEGGLTIRLKQK